MASSRHILADVVRQAVAKSGNGTIVLTRDYEVSEPFSFFNEAGLEILGVGGRRPTLYWTGDADNLFDFANCRDTLMRGFRVEVTGKLGNVFHYWRKVKGQTTPTNNRHESIAVLAQPGGSLARFASQDTYDHLERPAGIDENNEFGLYRDIDVDGNVADGIRFVGQQSHGHVLERCRLNVQHNAVVSSGWFSATDVSGSGVGGAAFNVVGTSAPIHIVRPNFEAIVKLLHLGGSNNFTGDSQAVLIEGGSTRCDQVDPIQPLIEVCGPGPVRIVGHQFGSGKQPVPFIQTWHHGAVTIESCDFGSWGSAESVAVRLPDGRRDSRSLVMGSTAHWSNGTVLHDYAGFGGKP